ncbi:hypothetical protein G4228_010529 [Cervus hanglu yarkandensis]|nr:hypothetical protein G4228_010529 [Cervus hanglu yarkandensis]
MSWCGELRLLALKPHRIGRLLECVKLTLSALVDGKSINAGGHKLGLALELEA